MKWLRSGTYHVGGGRQLLDDDATVGACLAVLVVGEPRAEALVLLAVWQWSVRMAWRTV
jgi:hypothetical protein